MINRLIKLYCFNTFSLKRILFYIVLVIAYIIMFISGDKDILWILCPYPQNTSIKEMFIYLYYQLLILLPVGYFIDSYIKKFFLPYFIRIRNISVWYISVLIFSYTLTFIVNLFIVIAGEIFYYMITQNISIIDSKILIFAIVNNIFIITLFLYLIIITNNIIVANLIILFLQIIISNLILINKTLDSFNFLYLAIFISTFILVSLKTICKNTQNIIENGASN